MTGKRAASLLALAALWPTVLSAEPVSRVPRIVAYDGAFLGEITCASIGNRYGPYGSRYAARSIWNPYGSYGSRYADESAYNPYATKPPAVVASGRIVAYVTMNRFFPKGPRISPTAIDAKLQEECALDEPLREP